MWIYKKKETVKFKDENKKQKKIKEESIYEEF